MFRKSKKQQAKLHEALLGVATNKYLQKNNYDKTNNNKDNNSGNSSNASDEENHGAKMQVMSKLKIA